MQREPAPSPLYPATLHLLLRRDQPLDGREHEAVTELAARQARRPWSRVAVDELVGLEGLGTARVLLRVRVLEPDPEGAELQRLCELVDELCATVPGCVVQADDPLALLGEREGRLLAEGRHLLPPLPEGAAVPAACRLLGAAAVEDGPDPVAPTTQAELYDLLEIAQAAGGTAPVGHLALSYRHVPGLREALFSGIRPGAACRLLAGLVDRELSDRPALVEGARALQGDGDADERQAATTLLAALGAAAGPGGPPDGPGLEILPRLGRQLLRTPGLAAEDEDDSGQLGSDWEDDLDLSELLADEAAPDDPLDEALGALATEQADAVASLARLDRVGDADHARRVVARLDADDESAAAACALLILGAWRPGRLPGWLGRLAALARGPRPWPVRALALRALGRAGGPDATALLLQAVETEPAPLAGAALRALAAVPGAAARLAVRAAAERPGLALHALRAMAEAGDGGGLERALALTRHEEPAVRAQAATTAARVGGSRALPALEALLSDPARPVQEAAAAALGRVASPQRLRALVTSAPPALGAAALRAAGDAGAVRTWPLAHAATTHPDPALRQAAAEALGALGLPAATPRLLELLLDDEVPVALAALDALGRAGDQRAVRLLRLLAAHPGLPGRRAGAVLQRARQLRRPAPDDQVMVRARARHPLGAEARAEVARAFIRLPLRLRVGDQQFAGEATVPPEAVDTLVALAAALQAVDEAVPGLRWSVRDPQGLLRHGPRGWTLAGEDRAATVQRAAGWWSPEAPRVGRVPLTAEVVQRVADPAADEALPIGMAQPADPLLDEPHDEDAEDDATEQTISGFLEEITGQEDPVAAELADAFGHAGPPAGHVARGDDEPTVWGAPPPRGAAPPPRRSPLPVQGTDTADGLEEVLFDLEPTRSPPRR